MSTTLPKVCVIGAGSCGLPVIKALKERGIPVTCYEKTANIGGLWCIENKAAGATAAYDSLHINTDTRMMKYRDYPMPDSIPAYPSHTEIHRYFRNYAEHSYRNPSDPIATRGKRVMVVGLGNSSVDIASELGHRSSGARCILSVRRGAWIMPKFVFGLPLTRPFVSVPHWVAWQIGGIILDLAARMVFGTPMAYGLPRPEHKWLRSHPMISQDIYSRLGHGDIAVKPCIKEFDGRTVRFVDGSAERSI